MKAHDLRIEPKRLLRTLMFPDVRLRVSGIGIVLHLAVRGTAGRVNWSASDSFLNGSGVTRFFEDFRLRLYELPVREIEEFGQLMGEMVFVSVD